MKEERALRESLVATGLALERAGFAVAKSGNVSCRWGDGLLITPSGLPYAATTPDDLVALALDGTPRGADRTPSSEWRFHTAVYRARPEAQAIVHTHSPKASALSCTRRGIPAFHYTVALAGGPDIRCAEYATFGTQALADNAVRALEGRRAVLLANHGVIAFGATLDHAFVLAQEVESLAGRYLALLAAGLEPVILDEEEMRRVAAQFARYGRLP
ncbi:MAG: class II aldolase/adducin family protein [Gemmatimonadetes bacterium]|nr:class II aldolase/adducin family protein [Gemmatimonadota bacterium]